LLAFRDFLDSWFSRYGPISDWKKSIFKNFFKNRGYRERLKMVLFWRVTSGKKYLKIFGSLGVLWQVVKLGKTRYFQNFENFLKIQDWSVSDWLGFFEKYYVSCCNLIFLLIFGMHSFGCKERSANSAKNRFFRKFFSKKIAIYKLNK
jgi:hypothetical protein